MTARAHGDPLPPEPGAACPVCGLAPAAMFRTQLVRNGFAVVRCPRCGVLQLSASARFEAARTHAELYGAGYYQAWGLDAEARGVDALARMKRVTFRRLLRAIEASSAGRRGTLLDVGCSLGLLLETARDRGWRVHGLEASPWAAEQARGRLGDGVVQVGTLDTAALGRYDAVTLVDVLEHLEQPGAALARCRELLAPRGVLALVLPTVDTWSARLMGRHWTHYKLEHVTYFHRAQLRGLLAQHGLRVVADRPALKGLTLDFVRHHLGEYHTAGLTQLAAGLARLVPAPLARFPVLLPCGERLILACAETAR